MTEIEILKEQIKALEKLIEIKNQTIKELEKKQSNSFSDWIKQNPNNPFDQIKYKELAVPANHVCEYPNPWFATVPPSCLKCGKQAPGYTITCTTSSLCNHEFETYNWENGSSTTCKKCGYGSGSLISTTGYLQVNNG